VRYTGLSFKNIFITALRYACLATKIRHGFGNKAGARCSY